MGKEHGARSVTVQVVRLVDAAMTHLGLAEGEDVDPDEWVPLCDLLGSALVPPDAAETIREVVAAMTKAGKAEPKRGWQAVVELAAAYLDPRLRGMICCDTCPYSPTCEEEDDFLRQIFGLDEDGEPVD
jgi:hypothetical protein